MAQYGYYPRAPVQFTASDQSALDSLAIFHFIYAGFLALTGLVVVGIGALGSAFVASAAHRHGSGFLAGGAFMVVMFVVAAFIFLKAGVVCFSGVGLRKARYRVVTQIVACLCCLNVPFGTVLGVFTLVVLSRPSVLALYQYREQGGVG